MTTAERILSGSFWAGAGVGFWVAVGYPLSLLAGRARSETDVVASAELPSVSIVIPAWCERDELPRKLRALNDLDYPPESIEVIVVVDEDEDLARAAAEALPSARVLFSPERSGKAAALNRGVAAAGGEALLLTDANNVIDPGALRASVGHLAAPGVSAVGGRRGEAGSPYATYECAIRRLESRSGSVAALSGEFVLLRRDRAPRFPEGVINDDLWLLCELVRRGGRVVYEPRARSREQRLRGAAELERRTRIAAGRAQLLGELRGLPWRFRARLLSHKFGRLALPPAVAITFLSAVALSRRRFFRFAAGAQLLALIAAVASLVRGRAAGREGAAARVGRELSIGLIGTAGGVIRAARGRQSARWEPVR